MDLVLRVVFSGKLRMRAASTLVEGPDADPRRPAVLDDYDPIVEAPDTLRLGLAAVMEFIRWALPDSDSNKRPKYEMVAGHDLVLTTARAHFLSEWPGPAVAWFGPCVM